MAKVVVVERIAIVGVGALGSHVAQFLRNEAELKLIDFDRIEQKNVLSQFYGKSNIGKNKALSMRVMFDFLFGLKPVAITNRLGHDNAKQLLGDVDLIIDCLDNIESRLIVAQFAEDHGTPCLHGAVDADGSFGRVEWTEVFKPDRESAGAATCEGGEHLPFITSVASFIARSAQTFIRTGKKQSFSIGPVGAIHTA